MRARVDLALIGLTASLATAVASSASAEPTGEDRALATILFNEGRAMMAEGKVPEACRKLEESERLDPLPGTLLNLAACHEREGRMASAFSEFREARVLAERDHRDDRVAFADQHLSAIEPKISRLVIVLAPGVDAPELRITHDGTPLGRAAWGTRIPVDPGEHVIEASAPSKRTSRMIVNVLPEGQVRTVEVAALEDEPAAVASAPSSPPVAEVARPEPASETDGLSTRRKGALIAGGIGLVGIGLGTVLGVRAIQKNGDPGAVCTTNPCSQTSISLNSQAKFAADASTVSFAVALAALGVGAFMWFGDPGAKPNASAVTFAPAWAPGSAGVDMRARF